MKLKKFIILSIGAATLAFSAPITHASVASFAIVHHNLTEEESAKEKLMQKKRADEQDKANQETIANVKHFFHTLFSNKTNDEQSQSQHDIVFKPKK